MSIGTPAGGRNGPDLLGTSELFLAGISSPRAVSMQMRDLSYQMNP